MRQRRNVLRFRSDASAAGAAYFASSRVVVVRGRRRRSRDPSPDVRARKRSVARASVALALYKLFDPARTTAFAADASTSQCTSPFLSLSSLRRFTPRLLRWVVSALVAVVRQLVLISSRRRFRQLVLFIVTVQVSRNRHLHRFPPVSVSRQLQAQSVSFFVLLPICTAVVPPAGFAGLPSLSFLFNLFSVVNLSTCRV